MHHLQTKIHEIRGQKVLLDFDLAEPYEIETRVLNQAVKRMANYVITNCDDIYLKKT
ncbi:ORF6N domain-containing protein [Flavobacterium sp.]|uniref:ORF6N domain-containing protein n=1 Tax=Flavobacterium sp. TaxID=239 RepID=UPI0032C2407F